MTASVAYGWAGAVMQFNSLFGINFDCVTDQRSDRRTDQRTNLESRVRDRSNLKSQFDFADLVS